MADAEPNYGFDDSRRLTGPNRYFAEPAVTLTPLGKAAADPAAHEAWAARIRSLAAALAWPDPQPVIERRTSGTTLIFRAPREALLTATELSEWAWERVAADAGESGFDRAHDFGNDAASILAARARAERHEALGRLRAAANAHRVPLFEDDEEISLGAGSGSRTWPRSAPPDVDAVPWTAIHDIPTALVSGSNGKTTTVRLLAAMAAAAGVTPGYCSTEGVFIAGRAAALGDYSGPAGARSVLRHPDVQVAVLETARGGILRRGLAVERADVAVVTNIRADHFGEYGIESADDLAETKLVVARAVCRGGTLVLNADDTTLMSAAQRLPHAGASRQALFAFDFAQPALAALRERGGSICGVRDGALVLHHSGEEHTIGDAAALPLSLGGGARYNISNLAAAALAGAALGLPLASVLSTLRHFGERPQDNPGRLERWSFRGAAVLVDYAHNPDGLESLLTAARSLKPARLLLLLGQAGNRDDAAIKELARIAARFKPDRVVIKELVHMLRGRAPGEVPEMIRRELSNAGMPGDRLYTEPDEETAARSLLDAAQPGDVIVLPVHTRDVRERLKCTLEAEMSGSRAAVNGDSNHILSE
jgi:UDP-N-acetylmuramyl tripeptide synthase